MLKSTHKPSANPPPPLPPDWTAHTAPTGHTYYYNAVTKKSQYQRPGLSPAANTPPPPPPPQFPQPTNANPNASYLQYSVIPQLSDPAAANAWQAQFNPRPQHDPRGGHTGGGRGGHHDRPRPQPRDKPKSKVAVPGCEPWILVYTKYGRRFAYNPDKKASYWRIPEKVMKGVVELDIQAAKAKASGDGKAKGAAAEGPRPEATGSEDQDVTMEDAPAQEKGEALPGDELGSDYEEVEVTDSEGEHDEEGEGASKRQRTGEATEDGGPSGPVEFSEADFAAQLRAMGEDYGLDPGEYDDGDEANWPEGAEGLPLSDADAKALFTDLLADHGVNPYSPWDKLIEDGSPVVDDSRWTVLPNMKARRDVWEEWSRAQIVVIKERRAREEKQDPRIPFMALLQEKATPKLYWPEFKRKYRKEGPLRDTSLTDKEREKLYRDYVARVKMPLDAQKKDLSALLRSIPAKDLNSKTLPENLPSTLVVDVRYAALSPTLRNPLVKAYIETLPPPPSSDEAEEDEAARKTRDERRKREKALQERERVVEEQKRRQRRQLEHGRAVLREEERELERAQQVGKKGLQRQLLAEREAKGGDPAVGAAGAASSRPEE